MSAPIFKLTADATKFVNAMNELARVTKKPMAKIVTQQTKLFLEKFVEYQRPESGPKGRERVARDILWVFRPITSTGASSKAIAEGMTNDAEMRQKWLAKVRNPVLKKRLEIYTGKNLTMSVAAMLERMKLASGSGPTQNTYGFPKSSVILPELHQLARNSRGSVRKRNRNAVIYTGPLSALRAYTKKVQERIGMGEGGWVKAAASVKARLPVYVRKHATNEGGVKLHLEQPDGKTYITIWNTNKGAVEQDSRSNLVARTARQRVKDLEATVRRILDREISKANR